MKTIFSIVLTLALAGACDDGGGSAAPDGPGAAAGDAGPEVWDDVRTAADVTVESGTADVPGDEAPGAPDVSPDVADAPFLAVAPCADPAMFVSGVTSVATTGGSYSPACLQVPVGASVTIEASIEHPLQPRSGGTPGNPIPDQQSTATVVFPAAGIFPYQCPEHVGNGMIGVIWAR